MFQVDKYHPVQGVNKFQTVSFPITKAVAVDFGAQTTANATVELCTIPKGSIVLGISVRITETLASTNAATIQFGFTGTPMLTAALTSASTDAAAGQVHGAIYAMGSSLASSGTAWVSYTPMQLRADDTFDCILATDPPSAGKADCYITYIPVPSGDIDTANFLSIVCT